MKICGGCSFSKHRDIKDNDKYITLDILLKFGSLDKIRITSSEWKYNLVISVKGLITSLCIKAKASPKKYKKAIYAIRNFSMNDLSKIIREFENCLIKVMRGGGPNMSPLTVNFTYQNILRSLWWELMPSTSTINL